MKRSRRLLLLPFLLLVPLGVLKWRADHPPVSTMDRTLQAVVGNAPWISIEGSGGVGRERFNLGAFQNVLVRNRAIANEIVRTLRCTEQWKPSQTSGITGHYDFDLIFLVPVPPFHGKTMQIRSFYYQRDATGSYLLAYSQSAGIGNRYAVVNPRFAPCFEALITSLVQQAKAPGHHPKVILQNGLFIP